MSDTVEKNVLSYRSKHGAAMVLSEVTSVQVVRLVPRPRPDDWKRTIASRDEPRPRYKNEVSAS
jgi:hypothetical protein